MGVLLCTRRVDSWRDCPPERCTRTRESPKGKGHLEPEARPGHAESEDGEAAHAERRCGPLQRLELGRALRRHHHHLPGDVASSSSRCSG